MIYNHFGANRVVDDEGNTIASKPGDVNVCKQFCNENSNCKSFAVCGNTGTFHCWLKDKILDGSEAWHSANTCFTYYHNCGRYYYILSGYAKQNELIRKN